MQRERGAAMVETAMVLTLLVMLLVGTVTAAIAFSRNNSIENAAREASRYAATLPNVGDPDNLQVVIGVARAAAQGDLDTTVPGQYICVAYYDGVATWTRRTETGGTLSGPSAQHCFSDDLPGDQERIQVVTGRDSTIEAVLFSTDVSLKGQAAARYER